ncbi:hypothetical protein T484DRAFT_3371415 [Baffinella frigidus]|nr:hypothetical protein T484DRAFT_3371415 [Cryptophyta sp. CCMP2293]
MTRINVGPCGGACRYSRVTPVLENHGHGGVGACRRPLPRTTQERRCVSKFFEKPLVVVCRGTPAGGRSRSSRHVGRNRCTPDTSGVDHAGRVRSATFSSRVAGKKIHAQQPPRHPSMRFRATRFSDPALLSSRLCPNSTLNPSVPRACHKRDQTTFITDRDQLDHHVFPSVKTLQDQDLNSKKLKREERSAGVGGGPVEQGRGQGGAAGGGRVCRGAPRGHCRGPHPSTPRLRAQVAAARASTPFINTY